MSDYLMFSGHVKTSIKKWIIQETKIVNKETREEPSLQESRAPEPCMTAAVMWATGTGWAAGVLWLFGCLHSPADKTKTAAPRGNILLTLYIRC